METGDFNIAVQAQGQSPPDQQTFNFIHEVDSVTGTETWAFETDLEGWTVQQGTWVLSNARVNPGGSTQSVHSSQNLDNQCDIMVSASVLIDSAVPSSTLTVPNWFAIEPGPTWYDRAHVHIIDLDTGGTRTLVSPSGGKAYQTGTYSNAGATCSNTGTELGWSGDTTGNFWGNSTFNLNSFIGKNIREEVKY